MKRAREGDGGGSALKRAASDSGVTADENQSSVFFLGHQNRALSRELTRSKRKIAAFREKVDSLEKDNATMESFVSVIDKAWSQLDLDIGTLLSSLEESESSRNSTDTTSIRSDTQSLYSKFLDAGNIHTLSGLVDVGAVDVNENLDKWSTEDEIEKEKERILVALKDGESLTKATLVENLRSDLSSRASLTSDVLRRCWDAVEKAHGGIIKKETIMNAADLKEKAAEASFYKNLLLKAKSESVKLLFELRRVHDEKRKLQRAYDNLDIEKSKDKVSKESMGSAKATTTHTASTATFNSSSKESVHSTGDVPSGAPTPSSKAPSCPQTPAPSSGSVDQSDLAKKMAVLEQQLEKSHGEVSRLEKELTACMSVPFMPEEVKEAYREDILKVVTILKQQIDTTVQEQRGTIRELNERIIALQSVIDNLQVHSKTMIEQSASLVEAERKTCQAEVDVMKKKLVVAESGVWELESLRKSVEKSKQAEIEYTESEEKHRKYIKTVHDQKDKLEGLLSNSRSREVELEKRIAILNDGEKDNDKFAKVVNGEGTDGKSIDEIVKAMDTEWNSNLENVPMIYMAQKRLEETQKQLEDAISNEKDLLMELEAITGNVATLKGNIKDLNKQLEAMHEAELASRKNQMGTQNEMADYKKKIETIAEKESIHEKYRKAQDIIVEDLKNRIRSLEGQLATTKSEKEDLAVKDLSNGTINLENKEIIEAKEAEILKAQGTVDRLQNRCNELTEQVKVEKKMRMESERESAAAKDGGIATTSKKSKKGDVKTPRAPLEDTERIKLDRCLSLLRCSVCLSNFKTHVLTRCLHLFCEECILKRIQVRSRKCPLCSEKFTENEFKKVYFD